MSFLQQLLDSANRTRSGNTAMAQMLRVLKERQAQAAVLPTGGSGGPVPQRGVVPGGDATHPHYKGGGNVDTWIRTALQRLNLDESYVPGIRNMIMHESGGRPNAINKWDSNWKAGHPSKGLMQTIDPTFQRWRDKNLPDNPYDPIANIIAGVNYARHRYGDAMLKSGGRKNKQGKYQGY